MKLNATLSLKKFATLGLTLLSFQAYASDLGKITSLDRIEMRLVDGAIYSSCDVRRMAECKTSPGAFVTDTLVNYTNHGKLRLQGVPVTRKSHESRIKEIDSILASGESGLVSSAEDLIKEKNARQNAIFDLEKGVIGENLFLTGAILKSKTKKSNEENEFQSVDFFDYDLNHKYDESIRVIYEPTMGMNFIIERYLGEVVRGEGKLLERILVKCEQREMVNSYQIASMKLSFQATPELECTTNGNGRLRFEMRAK